MGRACRGILCRRFSGLARQPIVGMPTEVNLGMAYENGEGVERDFMHAAQWLRKAADQGSPLAQQRLGQLFQVGQGCRRLCASRAVAW
jgi:TPR repeat protein